MGLPFMAVEVLGLFAERIGVGAYRGYIPRGRQGVGNFKRRRADRRVEWRSPQIDWHPEADGSPKVIRTVVLWTGLEKGYHSSDG